jgi:hypothetical protein
VLTQALIVTAGICWAVMLCACQSASETGAAAAAADGTGGPMAEADRPTITRLVAQGAYGGEGGFFDLSRDVLRDEGFVLERVDAEAGVITTRPKSTAGLATPWYSDQSTAYQEIEDLGNRDQRTVRITFEPRDAGTIDTSGPDLRAFDCGMTMTVRVIMERVNRPGWRVNTSSVRLSTYCVDTDLRDRGISYEYAVARQDDQALAARLADEIVLRHGRMSSARP